MSERPTPLEYDDWDVNLYFWAEDVPSFITVSCGGECAPINPRVPVAATDEAENAQGES